MQEAGSSTPLRFAQNDNKDGARRVVVKWRWPDGVRAAVGYYRGNQILTNAHEGMPVSEVNVSVSPQQGASLAAQDARSQRPLRIALFGFGTVGSSVARILVESKPQGLELTHVFNRGVERKRVDWTAGSVE